MNKSNTATTAENKKEIPVMCLCPRCANNYRDSGYLLVNRGWQDVKAPCDFCQTGRGVDYGVFPKNNKGGSIHEQ